MSDPIAHHAIVETPEARREVIPHVGPRAWRRPVWTVVLVVVGATGLGGWLFTHQGNHVRYVTSAVKEGPIAARVVANGTIAARVTVQVGSQVSGRIQELLVDFNSRVRKGQVLARLDPELFRAAVAQARANLTAAEGNLIKARAGAANAAKVLARTKTLVAHDLVAGADFDSAEAGAKAGRGDTAAARGAVAQARAALRQAETNLGYATILSPVDGVVISRNVDVGQTVAASLQAPTLFTIAEDLRTMQVHTNIPEADVGKVRPAMKATFTVDAFPDEHWQGTVHEIRNAPQVIQNVVTYDAVVDVDNRDGRLRPGMTATVALEYAVRPRARLLPNAALRYLPKQGGLAEPGDERPPPGWRSVYVLPSGATQPVRTLVQLGISDAKVTEIVDGEIQVGDPLVIEERSGGASGGERGPAKENKESGGRRLPLKL